MWHRYYSPEIARFLSKDLDPGSVQDPKSLNPYIYCGDNPVNMVDPDGNSAMVLIAALGVGAGFAVAYTTVPGFKQAVNDFVSETYNLASQNLPRPGEIPEFNVALLRNAQEFMTVGRYSKQNMPPKMPKWSGYWGTLAAIAVGICAVNYYASDYYRQFYADLERLKKGKNKLF